VFDELGMDPDRAEVGEDTHPPAQPEQPCLAAQRAAEVIPLGAADGSEQDRVGATAGVEGGGGQRGPGLVDGAPPDQPLLDLEVDPGLGADRGEDAQGHARDLGADPVSRQRHDMSSHQPASTPRERSGIQAGRRAS
jgi:hypothetical protein